MKSILDRYHRFLKIAMTALLALMLLPVTMQIVSRFSDLVPRYIWTEEVARFCFVWIIMIGSMVAVRDGSHFDVDVMPAAKSHREAAVGKLTVHLAMIALALVFAWYGAAFAWTGFGQKSEMSGLNLLSIYISFPLAGVTWALFLVEKIVEDVRSIRRRGDRELPR